MKNILKTMKFDFAIIGGGPAGYTSAIEASKYGKSVILFEEKEMGGTCLNRGCIPTKFLAAAGEYLNETKNSSRFGVLSKNVEIDFKETLKQKNKVIMELRSNLVDLILQNKIKIIYSNAELIDAKTILCEKEKYYADNILIATGSVVNSSFVNHSISSDQLLELDYIPETMKIIGGGVVAVEFASIFNALGTKVTINIRGNRILRKWDKELSIGLTQNMKKNGITINNKCTENQMKEHQNEIVLSAIGRLPNLDGINKNLVDIGEDGGIIVDEYGRTKTSGIYAAGDVISGSVQLAHVAMEQGKRVAQYLFNTSTYNSAAVVNCIYTNPEIASVGMTELEAKEAGVKIICAKKNMNSNARTMISTSERGFIKIIANSDTHIILGAQLMCERASDIVSEIALAINNKMTVVQMIQSTRPHPSYCEAITDVLESLLEKINEI